ncbi:ABC transporter permease [Halorarius halobius]|uniref:ABC transporter permease n=1 Tax=Halorarius halobius TaxID=2962671 RepID=UPI0020CEF774|nr:ABC transporter permease [Halorarius halobius]
MSERDIDAVSGSGTDDSANYEDGDIVKTESSFRYFIRKLLAKKIRIIATVTIIAIILVAIFAPVLAPHNPDETFGLFQPPNSHSVGHFDDDGQTERAFHPLGTDSFGHDVLSRVIFGTRISLLVAFASVGIGSFVGSLIGLLAGYYGGWIDDLLMRYIDFQWAFPEIVLAIGIVAFTGGLGVWNVVLAISIAYFDDFARVVRGEVLSIRESEYIKSARVIGMSDLRIMVKEILPNAVAPLIVQMTVLFPLAILWEASLSFLGLGVKPTTPTWGLLIASGRAYITSYWWITIVPGVAIMITALAFNIEGDTLRDIFDVKRGEELER